jgi:hypothetical protein
MQQHCRGAVAQQQEQQQQHHGKEPSWLMPWQTGNRQAGKNPLLAASLAGKSLNLRTPRAA